MKKVLALLVFGSMIIGCKKEDIKCNCDVDIVIVDGTVGAVGNYTITNVPSDCEGNIDIDALVLQENHWYQRTVNCE